MSTFADKPVRVFRSRSEEVKSRLRRKRSCGRLKAFNSNTDNRAWVINENERRRHILELMNSYETTVGNYIPYDELFKAFMRMCNAGGKIVQKSRAVSKALHTKALSNEREEVESNAKCRELDALAKCLNKAGCGLRQRNKCLQEEIERLRRRMEECGKSSGGGDECVEKQLNIAENRINTLLTEIEGLQRCQQKAECDAVQMINIIEQQQEQISQLQCLNCQLQDKYKPGVESHTKKNVLKKGGKLKTRTTTSNEEKPSSEGSSSSSDSSSSSSDEGSQDKQSKNCEQFLLEAEKKNLTCQLAAKEKELDTLNRTLERQSECIGSLKGMLMNQNNSVIQSFRSGSNSCCGGGHLRGGGGGGASEEYSKACCSKGQSNKDSAVTDVVEHNLVTPHEATQDKTTHNSNNSCCDCNEMVCKLQQSQCQVTKQCAVIISQKKCLLEQHKYILEQEQLRTRVQNKLRDQTRKYSELEYERNLLRNEIVFLTARLKTYLGKVKILERSIEEFFDNTKKEVFSRYPPDNIVNIPSSSLPYLPCSPKPECLFTTCAPVLDMCTKDCGTSFPAFVSPHSVLQECCALKKDKDLAA